MSLTPTIERLDDGFVVTLRGEIDAFTAPELRVELHRLTEVDEAQIVVVDLTLVTFLDSSGLGTLVGALRRLRERDGNLRIVRPASSADRIFALTGLDTVLDLYATRDDAISATAD